MSRVKLREEVLDLGDEPLDVGIDLLERARWGVLVEVPGERDLVADLGLGVVDPGVRDVREDLAGDVPVDVLTEANVLGVCLLYTSPSPRDRTRSRMPSSA